MTWSVRTTDSGSAELCLDGRPVLAVEAARHGARRIELHAHAITWQDGHDGEDDMLDVGLTHGGAAELRYTMAPMDLSDVPPGGIVADVMEWPRAVVVTHVAAPEDVPALRWYNAADPHCGRCGGSGRIAQLVPLGVEQPPMAWGPIYSPCVCTGLSS